MMASAIRLKIILLCVTLFVFALAFGAYAQLPSVSEHPVKITTKPKCSMCHKDQRSSFDHSVDWVKKHKFFAQRNYQYCNLCHKQSFCTDCHANKEEMKPSDKFMGSPARTLPHRADYLSRHRIDGKINPASCYKCHGRQNNARCLACHK